MEEQKKNSILKATISYGLILAAVLILFDLLMYSLDIKATKNPIQYISIIVMIAGIFMAAKQYRDKYCEGFITYGKSFQVSFLTGVFTSVILAIYSYLYFIYIDPSFIDRMLEMTEQAMRERMPEIDDVQLEKIMTMQERFMTPLFLALQSLLMQVLTCTVISLITSIFVKKQDNTVTTDIQ